MTFILSRSRSQQEKLFSRKRTICVTHRSQNIENTWAFLSFKVDVTFTLNDIDLQMTLPFKYTLVEYKHNYYLPHTRMIKSTMNMSTNLLLQQNNKRNTVTITNATTRPTTNPSMVSTTYIQKFFSESCGKPIVLKLLLTYVNKFLIRFFANKDLLHSLNLNDLKYNVLAEIFCIPLFGDLSAGLLSGGWSSTTRTFFSKVSETK